MGSYYCPVREYSDFNGEVNASNPHWPSLRGWVELTWLRPARQLLCLPPSAGIVLLAAVCVVSAAIPSVVPAAGFKTCKPVRVDLGMIMARVSRRNMSCRFARSFVRRSRRELCSLSESTIRGWRKIITGTAEDLTLTLRKGSKAIRTDACSA